MTTLLCIIPDRQSYRFLNLYIPREMKNPIDPMITQHLFDYYGVSYISDNYSDPIGKCLFVAIQTYRALWAHSRSASMRVMWLPMYPAPPVTRIFMPFIVPDEAGKLK